MSQNRAGRQSTAVKIITFRVNWGRSMRLADFVKPVLITDVRSFTVSFYRNVLQNYFY